MRLLPTQNPVTLFLPKTLNHPLFKSTGLKSPEIQVNKWSFGFMSQQRRCGHGEKDDSINIMFGRSTPTTAPHSVQRFL